MAARKNFSTGQIINTLRKAEVGIANGKAIKDVCRELGVTELPAHQLHGFAAGQTHLCLPQCSDDLLRSVSLPSHPDLLAEKLQTRSILTLHLASFQGVRSPGRDLARRQGIRYAYSQAGETGGRPVLSCARVNTAGLRSPAQARPRPIGIRRGAAFFVFAKSLFRTGTGHQPVRRAS